MEISSADADWEVCEVGLEQCAGVYTDGAGCHAYCGAAGLVCTARYGGEPGCNKEPQNVIGCDEQNGHTSDWCVCGLAGESTTTPDTDCPSDPQNSPVLLEQGYRSATYSPRHNWVLDCRDYGYTAGSAEHEACDGSYHPDGSRTGTATYVFENVPRGRYDVYVGGRHTENRNSSGARFLVNGQAVVINQRTGGDFEWDHHGRYCLEGRVEVVLDSAVNSGSDSTWGARLSPL